MACECANLDWSSVDLTRPHHPNCVIALNGAYLAAVDAYAARPVQADVDFSSRLGRFRLSDFLIRQYSEDVRAFMVGMVVVSAQYEFDTRAIIYLAMSERFDPVPEGERAPEYAVSFNGRAACRTSRVSEQAALTDGWIVERI